MNPIKILAALAALPEKFEAITYLQERIIRMLEKLLKQLQCIDDATNEIASDVREQRDRLEDQAKFDGWAIVEVMGYQRFAGYVTTQAFGSAVLFRIDVPALPERIAALRTGRYVEGAYLDAGNKAKKDAVPAFTKLVGAGSIYAITPCTEQAAKAACDAIADRPLIPIHLSLPMPEEPEDEEEINGEQA
jgi:hypothetical protein